MTKLRRFSLTAYEAPLCETIVDCPEPKGAEVLVRIERCGVCHSDLHIWEGYFDLGGGKRFYVKDRGCVPPFTVGHEPYGVVEKVGAGVHGVKPGDRRLVYPWIGCGKCASNSAPRASAGRSRPSSPRTSGARMRCAIR